VQTGAVRPTNNNGPAHRARGAATNRSAADAGAQAARSDGTLTDRRTDRVPLDLAGRAGGRRNLHLPLKVQVQTAQPVVRKG